MKSEIENAINILFKDANPDSIIPIKEDMLLPLVRILNSERRINNNGKSIGNGKTSNNVNWIS